MTSPAIRGPVERPDFSAPPSAVIQGQFLTFVPWRYSRPSRAHIEVNISEVVAGRDSEDDLFVLTATTQAPFPVIAEVVSLTTLDDVISSYLGDRALFRPGDRVSFESSAIHSGVLAVAAAKNLEVVDDRDRWCLPRWNHPLTFERTFDELGGPATQLALAVTSCWENDLHDVYAAERICTILKLMWAWPL